MKQVSTVFSKFRFGVVVLLGAAVLAACGGGGGSSSSQSSNSQNPPTVSAQVTLMQPASAPVTVSASGDPTADGIAYVNAMRNNVGFKQSLAVDSGLATASKNHTVYLVDNSTVGHYEQLGLPGYTGADPGSRIAGQGNYAGYGEVVVAGSTLAFTSSLSPVEVLFDAPYHRLVMLDNFASMGVANTTGASWEAFNIDFGNVSTAVSDTQLVAYPYPGQTGVWTTWFANESPNPFASAPQYQLTNVGYPVTVQGNMNAKLSSVNFTLTDSGGNPVLCQQQTPANDTELSNAAMCIPFNPLKANTTYTVHLTGVLTSTSITGSVQSLPIDQTWSFTTGVTASANVQMMGGAPQRPLPKF